MAAVPSDQSRTIPTNVKMQIDSAEQQATFERRILTDSSLLEDANSVKENGIDTSTLLQDANGKTDQ